MEAPSIFHLQSFPLLWEQFCQIIAFRTVQIFDLLLYSSVYLCCAVAGMTYTCCILQGISPTIPIMAILVGVVFSVYNLNRKTDEAEDALNHEKRFEVTSRFEKPLFFSALFSYAGILAIAAMNNLSTAFLALIPLVSGILYSVPVLPGTWQYRRLKEIPAIKNIVVAGAWGLTFSLIPVFMTDMKPTIATCIVFLFIFVWTIIGSVLPDIRDREGDDATGVRTIPVIFGVRKTRILLTAFNTFTGVFLVAAALVFLSLPAGIVLGCSVVYSQICILAIGNRETDNVLVDIISDGQFLTIGMITCLIPLILSFVVLPGNAMQLPFQFYYI